VSVVNRTAAIICEFSAGMPFKVAFLRRFRCGLMAI
jgi:hypothetical protein